MNTNYENICLEIAKQKHEKQVEIMDYLKETCSAEEYKALAIGIAYFRLLMYPELNRAMKETLSFMLYEEFNKKEV